MSTFHTFEDIYMHVADLLLDRPAHENTSVYHIEEHLYADVFIDSGYHIQVNLYESMEDFEEGNDTGGGGSCALWNDDADEGYDCAEDDDEYIDNLRKNGTPAQVCECITDKALFVWELIHSA